MSKVLFLDSFKHYDPATILGKWTGFSGTTPFTVPGRGGGNTISGGGTTIFKTFAASQPRLVAGLAVNLGAPPGVGSPSSPILGFNNFIDGPGNFAVLIGDGSGGLVVRLPDPGSPGTAFLYDFPVPVSSAVWNTWCYLEFSCETSTDPVAGLTTYTCEVHINGTVALPSSTVVLLTPGASGWLADPAWHTITLSFSDPIADFYAADEFLGNVRITPIYPVANGSVDQWTPNGAATNFDAVNDPVWNLSDYVSCPSSGVGNEDQYFLQKPLGPGKIMAVQFLWNLGKSDAGAGAVTGSIENGGTTEAITFDNGFTEVAPSADALIFSTSAFRKSPFTSADWTADELAVTQQGMVRSA